MFFIRHNLPYNKVNKIQTIKRYTFALTRTEVVAEAIKINGPKIQHRQENYLPLDILSEEKQRAKVCEMFNIISVSNTLTEKQLGTIKTTKQ